MTQSRRETSISDSVQVKLQEADQSKVTVIQSIIMGSVAGGIEVFIDHPLWTLKTRLQRGDSFTLKPSTLYRGMMPNMASMIPITAIQVGLNGFLQNVFFKDIKELSSVQRVMGAFVAGVGSAFVSCPTEMIMTYQGEAKCSFYAAYGALMKQSGFSSLFTGLPATAMREGMFTAFFLGVIPTLKLHIRPYCANDYIASVVAGISAGVGATVASQGVDTIKTIQQAASVSQPLCFKDAVKKLYSTHGMYGFFKGGIPRGTRVVSAVTIMSWVSEEVGTRLRNK